MGTRVWDKSRNVLLLSFYHVTLNIWLLPLVLGVHPDPWPSPAGPWPSPVSLGRMGIAGSVKLDLVEFELRLPRLLAV